MVLDLLAAFMWDSLSSEKFLVPQNFISFILIKHLQKPVFELQTLLCLSVIPSNVCFKMLSSHKVKGIADECDCLIME